ncbi:MAG TPA: multicopper oxidase domain-containing protein [Solirubrobacteraceae bacterium]|nr:multicopper oxidase domain-containing protein [Solirubrobacteraceae bacterium]
MSLTQTPLDLQPDSMAPHYVDDDELQILLEHDHEEREADRLALPGFLIATSVGAVMLAVIAIVTAVFALAGRSDEPTATSAAAGTAAAAAGTGAAVQPGTTAAPTIAQAKGVKFEPYQRPDPALPAVPAGTVKRFRVTVDEHVSQVSAALAPTQVWTYGVNGTSYPGTGGSPPLVVDQGDSVEITLANTGTLGMKVVMPHSIDFHSAEVAPNIDYTDIGPGATKKFSFVAKHPGVYMYHCATQPILMHAGSGMTGMMVVRPKGLPAADEYWLTQQEFFIGKPGGMADLAKIKAKNPDVVAFNGFADQYKTHPITVQRGKRIRMYVLNGGVSTWSAFHVIGTVFDRTMVEGTAGRHSQTINLAPSQGGWVDFTLDKEGNYPFVTHAFGDMVKGATGVLHTTGGPIPKGSGH